MSSVFLFQKELSWCHSNKCICLKEIQAIAEGIEETVRKGKKRNMGFLWQNLCVSHDLFSGGSCKLSYEHACGFSNERVLWVSLSLIWFDFQYRSQTLAIVMSLCCHLHVHIHQHPSNGYFILTSLACTH
jgi:hypothetical protein